MAQLYSEERQFQKALRTVEEAVRVSSVAQDATLLFMSQKVQVTLALAANDINLALTVVDRFNSPELYSQYPVRQVRAKGLEYEVALAAGLTSRAEWTMVEGIRLMRQHHLHEALGRALVDYSDFKLKSNRYLEAKALSEQALNLDSVAADRQTSNAAHFNHAIAEIYLGHVRNGKEEVEQTFKGLAGQTELLNFLPEYIAALNSAGDLDTSIRTAALQRKIEFETALYHAKDKSELQGQINNYSHLSELKAVEALNVRKQSEVWLSLAAISAIGLIGLTALYRRSRFVNQKLEESNRQLFTASNRDLLTGLFNRRYVENYVSRLLATQKDFSSPTQAKCGLVLLIDIDNFKQVNDTYGHGVGDHVLQVTAARLMALFREDDIVTRWGGEEFLVILPSTEASEACDIITRLLCAMYTGPIQLNNALLDVTISVGCCCLRLRLKDRELNWEEVVNLADQSLYLAKQTGKNMGYALTDAADVTAAEIAQGIRINRDANRIELLAVYGGSVELCNR